MSVTTRTSDGNIIKFEEDEDIYIECHPVDITGQVVNDETDNTLSENVNNEILDSVTSDFTMNNIFSNVGVQVIMGLLLLAILYTIGNYIFKNIPSKIINKSESTGSGAI